MKKQPRQATLKLGAPPLKSGRESTIVEVSKLVQLPETVKARLRPLVQCSAGHSVFLPDTDEVRRLLGTPREDK